MARINFLNYLALLTADAAVGDTALQISTEDADILKNGMTDGDYTLLMLTGPLYTEVVRVTKVGSLLSILRTQCESTGQDFKTGDCLTHYSGDCGEAVEPDCEPELTSNDESVVITGACNTGYDLSVPHPDSAEDFLCDLDLGSLLAGDLFVAITKATNGACTFKHINMAELCARLASCEAATPGDDCTCDVVFVIDEAGHLIVTYPDSTTGDLGLVQGVNGNDGADGADGVDGDDGADGADGAAGADGADGRSVVGATIDSNGHLILEFDQTPATLDVGQVVGEDGEDGTDPDIPQVARYTGNPSTGTTSSVTGMTVDYVLGNAVFTFVPPMPSADYFVSVANTDGTTSVVPITGRTATGFQIADPIPAGAISILVHE